MTYTLEKLSYAPVILATILEGYVPQRDITQSNAEGIKLLDACKKPVFYITDIRSLHEVPMDDILLAVNYSSQGSSSLYRHPKVREIIFITTDPVIEIAAPGLSHAIFGGIKASTFRTVEDALDYTRGIM